MEPSWPAKVSAIVAVVTVSLAVLGGVFAAGMWVCGVNRDRVDRDQGQGLGRQAPLSSRDCVDGRIVGREIGGDLEVHLCWPTSDVIGTRRR